MSFTQENIDKGYSLFGATNTYEIVNVSRDDVTISNIVNMFQQEKINGELFHIKQDMNDGRMIDVYDNFGELHDENKSGITDKLPYTI